jgi:hypothetical protein
MSAALGTALDVLFLTGYLVVVGFLWRETGESR